MAISLWVGVDWGSESHAFCILDADRNVLEDGTVPHTGKAIQGFVDGVLERYERSGKEIGVAIETPRGSIVDTLLDRGIRVFSINPKQLDRFRDRHTVAGAKDDRRDAFVLADSLRTDSVLFREVQLGEANIVSLRELVRIHEDLSAERVALSNRLHDQLNRYYPQILKLGSAHDDAWLWALLERAILPSQGKKLSLSKIGSILKGHSIRRLKPEDVHEILAQPPLHVAPGVQAAAVSHVSKLIPRLRLVHEQQKQCLKEIEALLDELARPEETAGKTEHRDATILRSFPGVGTLVSATMLTEGYEPLVARDYNRLRALCGVAPVTHQSGKRRSTVMRRACNHRLRNAVHHLAMNCVRRDHRAKAHYARLRASGHSHGRAIRGVVDRLLNVIIAMLKARTLFEPTKRDPLALPDPA